MRLHSNLRKNSKNFFFTEIGSVAVQCFQLVDIGAYCVILLQNEVN
jgi:hypothetical protein